MDEKSISSNFFIFLLLSFLFISVFIVLVVSPENGSKKSLKNLKTENKVGYSKDDQYVYLNDKKVENVDVKKFIILAPNFAKDDKWAYFSDGGRGNFKINNADVKTFELIGGNYAKDKSRYFCCQTECEVMKGLGNNFKVLKEGIYAKDDLSVYRSCEKLTGVESDSFRSLGVNYYLDKKHVYFVDQIVQSADSESFKVIDDIYGVDKNGIYYGAIKILDADPITFKPLGDYYSRDKTFVYFQGKVIGSGVDRASFEVLVNSFARDKNNVYYFGKKMPEIDRSSFEVLDIEYGRDKNNVYYNGMKIEKADPVSFTVLTNFFAKDKNYVYRYGAQTNLDVSTFKILENGKYQDKNGINSDEPNITK